MRPIRVLFALKERGTPYGNPDPKASVWNNRGFTGLSNSVRYVVQMLHEQGIDAKAVTLADNNKIDAAVKQYQATHVILEALWVVPSKLPVLIKANPSVKWNLRLHSELPFLAQEGVAISWIYGYLAQANTTVSINSLRAQADLSALLGHDVAYTPNYYPVLPLVPRGGLPADNVLDVGCFGAIRPLKNQLAQAVAAIEFANHLGKAMRFHINADRVEMQGQPILNNIKALFANNPKHTLVEHPWLNTADFIALCKTMDIAMQVSFSETFNICSADMVAQSVPIVVSKEVPWASPAVMADPSSIPDMVMKLEVAWAAKLTLVNKNYNGLVAYNKASEIAWPKALASM